jgi:hypothetical protein
MGKAGKVGIYSTTNYFLFEPVWFDLFGFILLKPKPNRTDLFFNFSNRFFSRFGFFNYCFSGFLGFNRFFGFFAHPYYTRERVARLDFMPEFGFRFIVK